MDPPGAKYDGPQKSPQQSSDDGVNLAIRPLILPEQTTAHEALDGARKVETLVEPLSASSPPQRVTSARPASETIAASVETPSEGSSSLPSPGISPEASTDGVEFAEQNLEDTAEYQSLTAAQRAYLHAMEDLLIPDVARAYSKELALNLFHGLFSTDAVGPVSIGLFAFRWPICVPGDDRLVEFRKKLYQEAFLY